jgi:hypothetical protein
MPLAVASDLADPFLGFVADSHDLVTLYGLFNDVSRYFHP